MPVSSPNNSDPVIQVCEHCLYIYGWQRGQGHTDSQRVSKLRPPYPCPRCGYLQEESKRKRIKSNQRKYFIWLATLCLSVLIVTFAASGLSMQWGVRPFGPIAVGGAILLVAVGIWSGLYRHVIAEDPNHNLKRRRKDVAALKESEVLLSYQDLANMSSDPQSLPSPPQWSWEEAEKRYRAEDHRSDFKKSVIRGFIYGLIPAMICLGSGKFYLDLTRGDWEYSNLYNGNHVERTHAIEYLWNHGTENQKELVAQWFSTAKLTSQEADIYLIHLKPIRTHFYPKILTGILAMQSGVPGPQAWEVLKTQPHTVANRVIYYLDKGVGDPARNLAILANLDPQTLSDTFEREIIVKPELIDKLGDYSTLMKKHWPVIAHGVLRSAEGDPRLQLQMINSFLKVAPDAPLEDFLRGSLRSLGSWVNEPVANDPKEFFRIAILDPRPEWVETLFEGIASATEDRILLSTQAGDAIGSLGPEVAQTALDPMFGSADELRWIKLRIKGRHRPIAAASHCAVLIDDFLDRNWGTLTPEVLAEQNQMKTELTDTAQTLQGIPLDENWVLQCRRAYKIQDSEVRHEWAKLLGNASPELLLEAFSPMNGAARSFHQWEVDSLIESIAENPTATMGDIARLLPLPGEESDRHMSSVVKYALLDYIRKAGSSAIIPILKPITLDDSTVKHSPEGIGEASETIRIGDFAKQVIQKLEEDTR